MAKKKVKTARKFKGVLDIGKLSKELSANTEGIPYIKEARFVFFANLGLIAISLALFALLPPEIPVFYGLPTGAEQIRPWWFISIPSLSSIFILGLNILLAKLTSQDFLKRALILAAFTVSFLSFVTTVKIIFLVGNIF